MSFDNQVIVVTGAAKGMGEATARAFARQGAKVALLDIDTSAGALAESFADRGLFVECDVSKESQVAQAFQKTIERFGGVDVLVNNAGIQRYSTVTETSEQEWDLVLNVNLKSAFLCARSAIPLMLERGSGVVINLASVQSFLTQPKVAPYATSKAALLGLTRSIAVDYAPQIRAIAVCPGTVNTPMLHNAAQESPDPDAVIEQCKQMHLLKRIAEPSEIAELIVFLSSDKAPFITGQAIRIDGGLGIMVGGSKQD